MPAVESLKCPNCGASVRGSGRVTCPYCGSTLDVRSSDRKQLRNIAAAFGTSGTKLAQGRKLHFKNSPGLDVTAQTKAVPFEPRISYARLPGGEPPPALQAEGQEIVRLVETTQTAVNREDLELYLSTIHPGYPAFYEKARRGAEAQFISGDMKRSTVAVEFTALTHEEAAAETAIEAFVFLPSGYVNHVEATFAYKLAKYEGGWKIYDSKVKSRRLAVPAVLIVVAIGAVAIVVGLTGAVAAVLHSCGSALEKTTTIKTVPVEQPEDLGAPAPDSPAERGPDAAGYYVASTGIPLFRRPAIDEDIATVIMPGTKFKVLEKRGDWFRVQSEDGARGWVPEAIIDANLGENFKLK
jgi:uncharacterized protein YgiM (DUF1202 family)/DNA-directed RNA polymerase subunit RPC12/RpoP